MDQIDLLPLLQGWPEFLQHIIIDIFPFAVALLIILILRALMTAILLRPMRALVGRSSADIDDKLLEASVSPLRIGVVGLSLILVTFLFSFDAPVEDLATTVGRALMIAALFYALARWFEVFSLQPEALARVTGWAIPERLLPFLNTLLKWLIIALGAIFVLQELNFDVAALIASLGVVGIGISLASQNTVSNMFGFAAIVSDNPFKVGDFIRTPDITGIVENVGVRSTRVRQLDQALITVPNNALTDAVVVNLSRMEKRRLDVTLTFTYSTSTQQMRDVVRRIRELLENTDDIDPESVMVHFVDFNSSSLDVRVICQVLLPDFRKFTAKKEAIFLEIMAIVESLGIDFAFPSRSLYIESTPERAASQAPADEEEAADPASAQT